MITARNVPGTSRREQPCPTCSRSLRRGLLWLRGSDYVECPDCEGTGVWRYYEQRVVPPPTRVFLAAAKG